jgi:hypothetical protein
LLNKQHDRADYRHDDYYACGDGGGFENAGGFY